MCHIFSYDVRVKTKINIACANLINSIPKEQNTKISDSSKIISCCNKPAKFCSKSCYALRHTREYSLMMENRKISVHPYLFSTHNE